MRLDLTKFGGPRSRSFAFTLAEVVMSLAIVATVFGGVLVAYIQACKRAEWSGYSLAAQGLAIQQLEQARSATWDPCMPTNQLMTLCLLTNFTGEGIRTNNGLPTYTGHSWTNLDLPMTGSNYVRATNFVTIRMLTNLNVQFQMVRVDTVWPFVWNSQTNLFTNSIGTYIAPDNRDNTTL